MHISVGNLSFNKMHLKVSSVKWQPFCLSFNMLTKRAMKSCHNLYSICQWSLLGDPGHVDLAWPWVVFVSNMTHQFCQFQGWGGYSGGHDRVSNIVSVINKRNMNKYCSSGWSSVNRTASFRWPSLNSAATDIPVIALGNFFLQNVILFSNINPFQCNISVWY